MAKVFVKGDTAYFLDPDTGERVSIPRDKIPQALAGGLVPLGGEQSGRAALVESLQDPGAQIAAGVAGAGRGLTLGLSDVLYKGMGVNPEMLTALGEAHPITSGVSEIGGTIGSAFLPGMPLQLAGRGAAALGRGVRGGLGAGLGARVAGGAAEDLMAGGAIGAGQSVSDIALTPEMTPGDAAQNFLEHTVTGGLTGGLIGAGARGVMAVGRKMRQVASAKMAKQLEAGLAQKRALEADLKAAKWAPEERAAAQKGKAGSLKDDIAKGEADVAIIYDEINVARQGLSATAKARSGPGVHGPRRLPPRRAAPAGSRWGRSEALDRAELRLDRAQDRLGKLRNKQATLTKEPTITPADQTKIAKLEAQLANLGSKTQLRRAGMLSEIGAAAVSYGLNGSAMGALPGGFLGNTLSLRGTKMFAAALAPIGRRAGSWVATLGRGTRSGGIPLVSALVNKIAPGAKVGAIAEMSDKELTTVVRAVVDTTPEEQEEALALHYPTVVPQNVRQEVTASLGRLTGYLQQWVDPREDRLPTGSEKEDELPQTPMRAIRAALDPDTVAEAFKDGKLADVQVQAFGAVYPEALEQWRDIVRAEVEHAKADGHRFERSHAQQIALLLGDGKMAPLMYDPATIRMFQEMHAASREKQEPPKRDQKFKIASSSETMSQRISEGVG